MKSKRVAMMASLVLMLFAAEMSWAQPQTRKKPSAIICQRLTKKADKQLCKETCVSWPLSKTCRVGLRFGSKGLQFVNKAQKNARYQRNIERNAINDYKFSPDEARRLRWYLTKHLQFFDPQDPTKSKKYVSMSQQRAVLQQFSVVKKAPTLAAKAKAMKKAVQIAEYSYGKHDINMQRIYLAGALYTKLAGQMGDARHYMKLSYNLASTRLPKDHPDRADVELRYAKLLLELGDQSLGLTIMQNAFNRIEALYQGYDKDNINARRLLARTLMLQGKHQSALPLLRHNIRDITILNGPGHKELVIAHVDLASIYRRTGDIIQARASYGKAMMILKQQKLETSTTAFRVWSGMGSLEMDAGRSSLDLAKFARRNKKLKKATKREDDAQESFLLAKAHFEKAQHIVKTASVLKNSHFRAELLHRMANTHQALKEPGKALELHKQAMTINHKVYGKTSARGMSSTRQVAHQLAIMGELKKAYEMLNDLIKSSGPKNSPDAQITFKTAQLAMLLGEKERARSLFLSTVKNNYAHLNSHSNITLNTTNMIMQYSTRRPALDWALSVLDQPNDTAQIWSLLVNWQGVVTRQAMYREREARFRRHVTPEHKKDYEQWRYGFMRGGKKSTQSMVLEKKLSALAGFKALTQPIDQSDKPKAICDALKQQKANLLSLNAVVQYSPKPAVNGQPQTIKSFQSALHYWAHVVTQDCTLRRIDLGTKKAVDALVATYRKTLKKAESCYAKRGAALCVKRLKKVSAASTALYEVIWSTATQGEPKIKPAKHWYIVPDGKLTQVNFDGLIDPTGKYLIEHTAITLLPYPTALLHTTKQPKKNKGALIVGDINYKRAVSTERALSSLKQCRGKRCKALDNKVREKLINANKKSALRRAKTSCGYTSKWGSLRTEATAVGKFLGGQIPAAVMLATGDSATEALIRQVAPNQRILHLATHGFFANTKACRDAMMRPILEAQVRGDEPVATPDLSMLTATILAGVNDKRDAPKDNDGLLEGAEVSKLDLGGTQLVVLSACETGLGVEVEGQGVLGLAQGYILAGAQHVIASLWQVPSAPTSQLFNDFYAHWLKSKKQHSIAQALRLAKLDAIKRARKKGLADSSFLWSSFQLTTTRRTVK